MKLLNTTRPLLNNKGFSLAEIMIVLVIIGGIMGLILPRILEGQDKSAINNTKIMMNTIDSKIAEYQAECKGQLPKSLEFMVADTADCPNWAASKKSKDLLKDKWNNDFIYEATTNGYNLKSLGKDKKEGGDGVNKDFYSQGSAANEE